MITDSYDVNEVGEPMPGSPVWEGGSQPGIELSKEGTSVSFLQRENRHYSF